MENEKKYNARITFDWILKAADNCSLEDFLSAALYGNSTIMVVSTGTQTYEEAEGETIEEKLADMLKKGHDVLFSDSEDEDINYVLNMEALETAAAPWFNKEQDMFFEVVRCGFDLDSASCLLEYAFTRGEGKIYG